MVKKKEGMEDLYLRYKRKVEEQLGEPAKDFYGLKKTASKEYKDFKAEFIPKYFTLYERFCNISEKVLKIKPDPHKEKILKEAIATCHLNITPAGSVSFAVLAPTVIILFGSLFFYLLFKDAFFIFIFFIVGLSIILPLLKLPEFIANNWRLRTSNQMVLCIFYVVTYMRHTSNMELAVEFASEHIGPPLSLDLRKVLWDVETGKYESLKVSLERYLESWKKFNLEFVEAFHLIESSLYEGSDSRRLDTLDKSLDVMLTETYEKMLHYAHNLKSPITMLHMLGVILPILGLVILPLVVSFMETVKWYHIAVIYDIAIPIAVFYLGKSILSKRPTGYGDTDITEQNPELKKYNNVIINLGKKEILINPLYLAIIIGSIFVFIGLTPIILHAFNFTDVGIGQLDPSEPCHKQFCFLGYKENGEGPFGLIAAILSILVTIGIGIGAGYYYTLRSKHVIEIRNQSKQLEQEFASALFQLGNRLGDGIPAEMACGKVATLMEGTVSGSFFRVVSSNIRRLGMGVEQAIFHPKIGALKQFPSAMIESSMKVMIESIKKGPQVAANALMNISRYIQEIHKVNERLKDLMADIIASMNSQIKFLSPAISGIVVGITSMVSTIIGKLTYYMKTTSTGGEVSSAANLANFFQASLPTFWFQIIVGIYVVEIIWILTILSNGIENGTDKLNERAMLGKNLTKSTILYSIIALIIILIFNLIAATIMSSMGIDAGMNF